jgi:uncharacterized protein
MKLTKFYLHTKLQDGQELLYNTYNTAMVTLTQKYFEEIFLNKNFIFDTVATESLKKLEFIIPDEMDEFSRIKTIKRSGVYSNRDIKAVTIAPTTLCNARCSYCFEAGRKFYTMDDRTMDGLISFLVKKCVQQQLHITWFGGEPLLATEQIDYITSGLVKAGLTLSGTVTTNGLLITEELIEKSINNWGVDKFQITIDALGTDYNRIKNYKGWEKKDAFNEILKRCALLLNAGIKFHVRVNYDPSNLQSALDTIDFVHNEFAGKPGFYLYAAPIDSKDVFSIAENWTKGGEHPLLTVMKKMIALGYFSIHEVQGSIVEDDITEALNYFKLFPNIITCQSTNIMRYTIGPLGEIYKCHRFLGNLDYTCGNVWDGVYYNDAFKMFCEEDYSLNECTADCVMLPICQGGCRANKILYGESHTCVLSKAIIKDLIELFYSSNLKKGGDKT